MFHHTWLLPSKNGPQTLWTDTKKKVWMKNEKCDDCGVIILPHSVETLTSVVLMLAWGHRSHRKRPEYGCCPRYHYLNQVESLLPRWEHPPHRTNLQRSSGGYEGSLSAHKWGYCSHNWKLGNKKKIDKQMSMCLCTSKNHKYLCFGHKLTSEYVTQCHHFTL